MQLGVAYVMALLVFQWAACWGRSMVVFAYIAAFAVIFAARGYSSAVCAHFS